MDEQQPAAASQLPVTSLMTRATNVFASPGELFTELRDSPIQTTSWLIPFIILIILGIVSTYSVYTNTTLRQQVYDRQEQQYRTAVSQGRMTQDQADQTMERMENSGAAMFVIFGSGIQIIIMSAVFFLGALIYWLAAKIILKFPGAYNKVLELFGVALWIGILGTIITLIMINLLNSLVASPGAGLLLLGSFDQTNKVHKLLAALNVFTLWQTGIIGYGLARICGKPTGTGLGISYGLWAVWTIISALVF
ncbi:MAG TPA: YIP1 family protein [Bacteroidota bacterium]|nr:YIP1 family protein [Bacteroidota bacterium]